MIKRIIVKELFGKFDYDIDFDNSENLTILTGLNGCGKTTLFTIIDSIVNNHIGELFFIPFKSIELFSQNRSIKIERINERTDGRSLHINSVKIFFPVEIKDRQTLEQIGTQAALTLPKDHDLPNVLINWVSGSQLKNTNLSLDANNPQPVLKDPIITFNYTILSQIRLAHHSIFADFDKKVVDELIKFKKDINNFVYIRDNRLMRKQNGKYEPAIVNYVNALNNIFYGALNHYQAISSQLDSSFIQDLNNSPEEMNEEAFKENIKNLSLSLTRLNHFGLNEKIKMSDKYNEEFKRVYTVYFRNAFKKIKVFDQVIAKLSLFETIINEKFDKKILSIKSGSAISILDTVTKRNIDISNLSSGEKQLFIQLYRMIFELEGDTVYLIDEPEISFHVAWQNNFLDNMVEIAKTYPQLKIQYIVATHAPSIIGARWDVAVDLTTINSKDNND